jgi:glyoxylase-like metal-dependent hydrolase (beta-lactamase superfamily II)/poly(3-hydroxybutyrate) depolymerase
MKKHLLSLITCLFAVIFFATAQSTPAQSAAPRKPTPESLRLAALFKSNIYKDAHGNALPYRYFEPTAPAPDKAKYPVILYLHGEDEAGTDNSAQLTTTDCATVWVETAHLTQHPSYVLAPQIPKGKDWTADPIYSSTLALLNQFVTSHPAADANRIYIVGFSMGATGLWNMLLKNPTLFAAAMPISGSADKFLGDTAAWAALKNTPVIIIHSYDDTIVPVGAALNAAAALQAGGNSFLGYGAPTPCIWSPGSTPSPHDAWWTAFRKFEVVYNSLFLGDLSRTHNGQIDPTTLYVKHDMGDGITQVWDYALGTSWIIERPGKAVIVDTTMGHGGLYQYIRDNVLKDKNVDLEVFLTHQHDDHIRGLASFIGADQLKRVYVHKEDAAAVIKMLGPDGGKVKLVKDGDLIPLGDKNVEVIGVPGHTFGSIIMKYDRYLFSGDSIGTGYIGVGAGSVEQYIGALQHLLDRMGTLHYTIYAGHTGELTAPMTEQYVYDLMKCARDLVSNTIIGPPYWRSGESSTRKVATVNGSSITYAIANVHTLKAALRGLTISSGTLLSGYASNFTDSSRTPGFSPVTQYYYASVGDNISTLAITPTVLDADYKSLTVNGNALKSGQAYNATLKSGINSFAITVTNDDGLSRTYTLNVNKTAQ